MQTDWKFPIARNATQECQTYHFLNELLMNQRKKVIQV